MDMTGGLMRYLLLLCCLASLGCFSLVKLANSSNASVNANYTLNVKSGANPGEAMAYVETVQGSGATTEKFKQELIYAGHEKDTLYLLYREYSNGLVRDGFTQELTYDLSQSAEIQAGPWQMTVSSYSNTYIQFVIVSDRGLSRPPSKSKK